MKRATPESRGVSSADIQHYLEILEANHLPLHNLLIARGDAILFEKYYPPFTPDMTHREYSQTKSLVAIAVGFALQDGLLTLDDTVEQHFAAEMEGIDDPNFRRLTVRHMMMMATARPAMNWFDRRRPDRVRQYFQDARPGSRPGGSFFEYDSSGTFVVGSLVERLTGKPLMDYLREKFLDEIGVHPDARCLKCPGGHSWSDSAALIRPEDMLKIGRFMLNGGSWNGKQLLDREFVRTATAKLIDTHIPGSSIESMGYGYYIWKAYGEGFYFNGMGSQFTLCVPETDMILVVNGDTQGLPNCPDIILGNFYREIVEKAGDPLPENPAAAAALAEYAAPLKLFAAYGEKSSPMAAKISGKTYALTENPMGISQLSLTFDDQGGRLILHKAGGEKVLPFGLTENAFYPFPEEGYSNEIGGIPGTRPYRAAASGAWSSPDTLWIKLQLLDDYFGNADFRLTFAEDTLTLSVSKTAEDFLWDYQGSAEGKMI